MPSNDRAGIAVVQPRDTGEREGVARKCCSSLGMTMPMVVDGMDDRVGHLYSAMPDRIYVLDADGRVAYKGGRGPFGFKPGEMEQTLVMLLLDQGGAGKDKGGAARPAQTGAPAGRWGVRRCLLTRRRGGAACPSGHGPWAAPAGPQAKSGTSRLPASLASVRKNQTSPPSCQACRTSSDGLSIPVATNRVISSHDTGPIRGPRQV
jgi:hypothetical protein